MRITIPEQYGDHFAKETLWLNLKEKDHCATKEYSKVFVSRWKNGALLLLNETEYDRLKEGMEMSVQEKPDAHGLLRFLNAGIHIAPMTNGEIDVPDHLASWLEGDDRQFTRQETGILVR